MAKSKNPKTLDNETFEWMKHQKVLKDVNSKPGRPVGPRTAAKRRQRYFHIRNVARKEIADLVKLARTLPERQFKQIFNVDRLLPQPYPEIKDLMDKSLSEIEYTKKVQEKLGEIQERTKPVDDFAELVFALLRYPVPTKSDPDANRAEIARLFIKLGFEYLNNMAPDLMTVSHEQTRAAAIDLANYLAESFKPKSERRYSRPYQGTYGY